MAENDQKRHAIMFAYPFQGHVIPAVHLAIKLASNGFTITFINTQSIHHQLSKAQLDDGDDDIFAGSRQSGLDIRYRTVSDGLPLEFDRNGNIVEFLERMLHEFLEYADELVGELVRTSTPPVTFLIADTLHVGLLEVANKYGLVSVSLWTQPALVLTLYYHLDLLRTHGHYASGTGHVIPAVHLAIKLASNGFTITFINTQSIHHQLSKAQPDEGDEDIFAGSRQSGLDLRYRTVSDGLPLEFDRNGNMDEFLERMLHEFLECADELVGELVRTSTPPVTFLIADTLHAGLLEVANKYGLVSVSLWTQPALVLTLYYHLDLLRSHGHYASGTDNREDIIDYIPGVQAIKPTDLISFLQETDTSTTTHQLICKAFDDVKRVDFIICNTVQDLELESEAISALHQNQPFFAIGPLLPSGFTKSTVATSLWPKSDCTQWLNNKPNGSVLYVSFGSVAQVSKNDIVEIAHGLSLSGVDFIWVLRRGIVSTGETQILPVGFEEEVKDRGLIVTWCSQIEVISHPSIGGFLTHCGWNSVLESVWCTVPLLCFPVFVDQITNRKLMVDDWRIGMNLCDEKPIRRKEVRETINHLMSGKRGDELRVEIKNMKRTLENALATNGSSEKNFNQFIKEVKFKTHQKHELALSKETII